MCGYVCVGEVLCELYFRWKISGGPPDRSVLGKLHLQCILVPDYVHLNDSYVHFSVTKIHIDVSSEHLLHEKKKKAISDTSFASVQS